MQKKNVLGTDPLSWLKGKNKKEKSGNNINEQEKQIDNPSKQNNESNIECNTQEEIVIEPGIVTEEQQDDELNIRNKSQEERVYEPSDVTERYRKAILGKKEYDYHVNTSHETTQKESPATAFVIVYTILLLILGFIVYRDLTKQIDKLNTKLGSIEKQVDAGFINYEDTKEVW